MSIEVSKESAWRLWASKQAADLNDKVEGIEAGREWASDTAEARELQRLSRWWTETNRGERVLAFEAEINGQENPVGDGLAVVITGDDECDTGEFWESAIGKAPDESPEWFRGFAEGAVAFWQAAKSQIAPKPDAV